MRLIGEMKEAELSGGSRRTYQTLWRIVIKDTQTRQEDTFTAEEYRGYFQKVSEKIYEREADEIEEICTSIPEARGQAFMVAALELESELTWNEFINELAKIKDSTAGVDGIRITAVKNLTDSVKECLITCVTRMLREPAEL